MIIQRQEKAVDLATNFRVKLS